MKRITKVTIKGLSVLLLLGFITFYFVYEYTPVINNSVEDLINYFIKKDGKVSFKNLSGVLINDAKMEDVKLELHNGEVIYAKSLDAKFNLLSIIAGKYDLAKVIVDSLTVDVENAKSSDREEVFFSLYHEIGKADIIVDYLKITNGQYIINRKDSNIFRDISFNGSFLYTSNKIDIQIRSSTAFWQKEQKLIESLTTRVEGDRDGIIFNQLNLIFENSSLLGKGIFKFNVKNNYQVFLDAVHMESHDLKFIDNFFNYDAVYDFNTEIVGDRYQFTADLNLNEATVEHLNFDKSNAKATYIFQRDQLNVIESDISVNNAKIEIRGDILNKNQYHAKFTNLNLAKMKLLDIKTRLNGEADFNQSDIDFSGKSTALNALTLNGSTIDKFYISNANIEFENREGDFFFTNNSYIRLPASANSYLNGEISLNKETLYLNVQSNNTDYANFLSSYNLPVINGKLNGYHTLSGFFDDVNLESVLYSDSIFFNNYKAVNSKINIQATDIFGGIIGDFEVRSGNVFAEGLEFDSLLFLSALDPDSVSIKKLSLIKGENGIDLEGGIYSIDSLTIYDFNKIHLSYNDYKISNSKSIKIKQVDSVYEFLDFSFVAPGGGSIKSNGRYDIMGGQLEILINNIDINPFNSLLDYKHSFLGIANGVINIHNFLNLKFTMDLDIKDLAVYPKKDSTIFQRIGFDTLEFGHVLTNLSYNDKELELKELSINDDLEQLYIKGNAKFFLSDTLDTDELIENAELDIKSSFKNIDLKKYNVFIGYYKELNGLFNGNIDIGGTLKNPKGEVNLETENLIVNRLRFAGFIKSHFDKKFWLFDSLKIKINESLVTGNGKKDLNFQVHNFWELFKNSPFEFNIKSQGDTITALSAISNEINAIIGKYSLDLKIAGTFDHPYIEDGKIRFWNTRFLVDRLANPLLNINYYGEIYKKRLILDGFRADTYYKSGGLLGLFKDEKQGSILVNGDVDFSHLFHPKLNLDVILDHFYVDYYRNNTQAIINSSNIKVVGTDTLNMTGDLKILDGDLHYEFGNELQRLHSEEINLSNRKTVMDFRIDISDNFRIRNEDPNGIRGMDFSIYTPVGEPFVYKKNSESQEEYRGKILIENGSFTSYKTFEIERGEIDFNIKDPQNTAFNPHVNGTALYEDDRYKYKLVVNNFLNRMLSEMRFEVYGQDNELIPLSREKAINLLAFGKEDFSDFDLGSAATNTALLLANTRFLSSIGIENISLNSDDEKDQNVNQESDLSRRVKLRTKQFSLYGNLKTQLQINSGASENRYLEQINLYYKLSDYFRVHFDANQKTNSIYSTQTDNSINLNLRLKWYYEF